ncbi:MAG: PAS domain S-box protein [Verrucomicrobia bacterium]|nr:PAS domain S-box protein [Verrucomicrobiota bacterium]
MEKVRFWAGGKGDVFRKPAVWPVAAALIAGWTLARRLFSARRNTLQVERLVAERTTEVRAAQQRLEEEIRRRQAAEERYRTFVQQSTDAISRVELEEPMPVDLPEDAQVKRLYDHSVLAECNNTFARMYGYERADEVIGKRLSELMPRDEPTNIKHMRSYIRSGYRMVDAESHELDRHGHLHIFLNDVTGIVENGRLLRTWAMQRDITRQRQLEEERTQMERRLVESQKLESLGILAGGIAHDFNNLLTGVLGNAGLIRLDLPPQSPLQELLERIEKNSIRAADLCKQLLAYSGQGRFLVQPLNLGTLLLDSKSLLEHSVSQKATLEFQLADNLPAVSADATQMRQILMNFVINASDALGDQPGAITIATDVVHADPAYLAGAHTGSELPAGNYVCLEVSDTGCGITPEMMQKIFDPFFTTKFTGRGLGLPAVLGIVRSHGGALLARSEPGKGSTFTVLLPPVARPPQSLPLETSPALPTAQP